MVFSLSGISRGRSWWWWTTFICWVWTCHLQIPWLLKVSYNKVNEDAQNVVSCDQNYVIVETCLWTQLGENIHFQKIFLRIVSASMMNYFFHRMYFFSYDYKTINIMFQLFTLSCFRIRIWKWEESMVGCSFAGRFSLSAGVCFQIYWHSIFISLSTQYFIPLMTIILWCIHKGCFFEGYFVPVIVFHLFYFY